MNFSVVDAAQDSDLEKDGFPNRVPITETFFLKFLSKFEKLQVLKLAWCDAVGDNCLSFLGTFCKDLRCVPYLTNISVALNNND